MPTGHFSGLGVELRVGYALTRSGITKQTCEAQFFSVLRAAPDRSRLIPDRAIRAYYGVDVQYQSAYSYEVFHLSELLE